MEEETKNLPVVYSKDSPIKLPPKSPPADNLEVTADIPDEIDPEREDPQEEKKLKYSKENIEERRLMVKRLLERHNTPKQIQTILNKTAVTEADKISYDTILDDCNWIKKESRFTFDQAKNKDSYMFVIDTTMEKLYAVEINLKNRIDLMDRARAKGEKVDENLYLRLLSEYKDTLAIIGDMYTDGIDIYNLTIDENDLTKEDEDEE